MRMTNTSATVYAALEAGSLPAAAVHTCNQYTYGDPFEVPFRSMVVFGDSFSDVGNIYAASNGAQPGVWTYDGRYSDGRVWEEYLVQFFDLEPLSASEEGGTDFAWGGATTNNKYISAYSTYLDAEVPAVSDQVTQYLQGNLEQRLAPDALHVLYSGYNDYWWFVYRNFTTSLGQDLDFELVYSTVASDVVVQVQRMYDAGARLFLVGNVPNMTSWAEAQAQPQTVLDAYDVLVAGHDKVLSRLLDFFEATHADATVYKFDAFGAFDCLNERKDFLGFLDIYDACHPSQEGNCKDVFSYKFWDDYHPTTHAHQFASQSAIQSIYDKEMSKKLASSKYLRSKKRV